MTHCNTKTSTLPKVPAKAAAANKQIRKQRSKFAA
jgi:hypothetical protein